MPCVVVFSEKDELAFNLLPKAAELAGEFETELNAVIFGPAAQRRATQYLGQGVAKVYTSENELLTEFDAQIYSQALFQIAEDCQADIILFASTKRGREVAARLAPMLSAGCLTNVLNIEVKDSRLVIDRYGLGGNTIISECLEASRNVIAVLPQNVQRIEAKPEKGLIFDFELRLNKSRVLVIERRERDRDRANIEKADYLVCVGRGLKQKEDLGIIQELANVAKGEIGCTKELASNLRWLSEDRVIGMSGKRCKPKLAFSIGISGQSQHVAGIVGAKIIVAINNDRNAPIFKVADYGITYDLYQAVPRLIQRLNSANQSARQRPQSE